MRLGSIIAYDDLTEGIAFTKAAGLETLQLRVKDCLQRTEDELNAVREALCDFRAESISAGWPGPAVWDFRNGPQTLGVVPVEYRDIRILSLKKSIDWAAELDIPLVQTHFGFIPENPVDPEYGVCVNILRELGSYAEKKNVRFLLETGQETPATLRRALDDAASPALGVNLDPANLIMYNKGEPLSAVEILKPYIVSLHIKDGVLPHDDMYQLGEETPVGFGMVPFTALFRKLRSVGFDGPMFIEREIPLPKQRDDILKSIPLLREWLRESRI